MKSRKRKRKREKKGTGIIVLVVLLICGVVSYKKMGLMDTYNQYQNQQSVLEKEKEEEIERQAELEDKKAYVQSKKYVEEQAREKLGLVGKDEIIFEMEK